MGDNWCVSWFHKDLNVGFFMDTVEVRFFKLCMRVALLLQCFWECLCHCQGMECCYDNGHLLLEFCSDHQLIITNTLFQREDRLKAARRHPHSKHWHLLDHTLTRQRDTRDILHTTMMPSADCYTDHRLVRCKVTFTFKFYKGMSALSVVDQNLEAVC